GTMAVSFSDLRLAFEFVSSGGSGENEAYLDGQSGKIYWHSEFDIAEAESGRVVVTAEPKDIHLNPAGSVHGGLPATMLDSCMRLAHQSTVERASVLRPLASRTAWTAAFACQRNRRRQRDSPWADWQSKQWAGIAFKTPWPSFPLAHRPCG